MVGFCEVWERRTGRHRECEARRRVITAHGRVARRGEGAVRTEEQPVLEMGGGDAVKEFIAAQFGIRRRPTP